MPQRSPQIFWLLLAATISVDAVAFSLRTSETFPTSIYINLTFYALIDSQLSVVCIWSAMSSRRILWTLAVVATALATLLTAIVGDEPRRFIDAFELHLAPYGLQAALLLAALWLFQRTSYWRRRSGIARELQYSVLHLLAAMTVVSVLATAMRGNPYYGDTKWLSIGFSCNNVALAVLCVFVWSLSRHWLLRLAAVLGFAVLLGAVIGLIADFGAIFSLAMCAHYLVQAIVLSAWLSSGQILPVPVGSADADSSPQSRRAP
jgi:hypothetical protein